MRIRHKRIARRKLVTLLVSLLLVFGLMFGIMPVFAATSIGNVTSQSEDGNVLIFNSDSNQVKVELCTSRTVRIQLSRDGANGYRPESEEYYMVQKNEWDPVKKTVSTVNAGQSDEYVSVKTSAMEIRIQTTPLRIGMYDLSGNLISKDTDNTGMYWNGNTVGVKKEESDVNAGGIFGFGSGDHGRRSELNRYNDDFDEFSMSHGRLIAPFFMSTVGYGIFLNTIEENTKFFKQGGGFETEGYLDYFFMYGPDFKTIQNEYAEITGRMEMYGKWAHGFMLSKYGNDNATQDEFYEWIDWFRDNDVPLDSYVFDYGWRGNVADDALGGQLGAGQKFGMQEWSDDISKFYDLDAMFEYAEEQGVHVGLHNNQGTYARYDSEEAWVQSYMDVVEAGHGDWFWPDEFDVVGSNAAPVLSSKGAYEAWIASDAVDSRPMFMTRGSYAGQHYATAWSGDVNNTSEELSYQIGYSLDAGLVGYWTVSNDLGGFMGRPTDELYTRWVAEFGAWSGIMRTHGHDGREPWTYNQTAQDTLTSNLQTRYSLYPYLYTMAWQGYSTGVPMMRAMILEDESQYNSDAWDLNEQYYFGDWFLVAPAADTYDTVVEVWLPANTTWYDYYTGERYEGGENGKTITVAAALEEIPVFVKAGAIVPMGPDVQYADEKPLDPLTLDIYPSGTSSYTLYEDDGETRRYITDSAYTTTEYTCIEDGSNVITFNIGARVNHNPSITDYMPDSRTYNLQFNHIADIVSVTNNNSVLRQVDSMSAYNAGTGVYYLDEANNILYVRVADTAQAMSIVITTETGINEPAEGPDSEGVPPQRISDGDKFELENAEMNAVSGGQVIADTEWKGYSGTGYAKGFKMEGDSLTVTVNIVRDGIYDLVLNVNNGKKNDATDASDRTGGLYLDDSESPIPLSFAVTDTWGDKNKNGVWTLYTLKDIELTAGQHTITIKAEGSNPGNFNLDYIQFNRHDTSTPAFEDIRAVNANFLSDGIEKGSDSITATVSGAYAQFNELRGDNKAAIELRVKSSTGGNIIVYENGVGDKTLATIEVPSDGEWHTITVDCQDTDATDSNIFIAFTAVDDEAVNISLEYFRFIRKVDAFDSFNAVDADAVHEEIKVNTAHLGNIYDGRWVRFDDLDFGDGGLQSLIVSAASHPSSQQGGTLSVYYDEMTAANKFGELTITDTGSWNTRQTFVGECEEITGVHDIFLVFNTSSGQAICDFYTFEFSTHKRTVQSVVTSEDGIGTTAVIISNDMADPGATVIFQVSEPAGTYTIDSIALTDAAGNEVEYTATEQASRYSFVVPQNTPVTISVHIVHIVFALPTIVTSEATLLELEDGSGVTDGNSIRVDTEWTGFTGTGYVAGWKDAGNYVEIRATVLVPGYYNIVLTGAAGKKNEAQYDNTPRMGALYIDGEKFEDFRLPVQDSWSTWITYEFSTSYLDAGTHTFKLVAEGDTNPGNFNLDSLKFTSPTDKDGLHALLEEVDALDSADYTAASWSSLREALTQARIVYNDADAEQNEIDSVLAALQTAKEQLVEASDEPTDPGTDDDNDPSDPGEPTDPAPGEDDTGGGCSGSAIGGGAALSALLIGAGAVVIATRRRKNTK